MNLPADQNGVIDEEDLEGVIQLVNEDNLDRITEQDDVNSQNEDNNDSNMELPASSEFMNNVISNDATKGITTSVGIVSTNEEKEIGSIACDSTSGETLASIAKEPTCIRVSVICLPGLENIA